MGQKGFTLVELMVGLVISMLCMIMMLMLFKQTTQIGISSSQDAEYDAQIQTGLLVAQKFIQNAGYGSGKTYDIKTGSYASNNALFWRLIPNVDSTSIAYQCQGIAERIAQDGNAYIHRLMLIRKTCNANNDWQLGAWEDDQVIVVFRSLKPEPVFNYNLITGQCSPFGIDKNATPGLRQVTINARREHVAGNIKNTICLNNIMDS